ncbi:MAG: hypothetical protein WC619_05560 [Patescibacteria group bacterium]
MNKNNKYLESGDWLNYALLSNSYIKSAEIICENNEIKEYHRLVMPMIYLLKHAIELSLKRILKFDFAVGNKKLHTHDLEVLEKIFLDKLSAFWINNNKQQKLWNGIKRDRLINRPMEFDNFVENFQKNMGAFLKNSGFVPNDELNQEQRFPYGEYSEPTLAIVNLFFSKRNKLVNLAMKITVDIDIIFDYILRVNKAAKS